MSDASVPSSEDSGRGSAQLPEPQSEDSLLRGLLYGLSFPERLIRSAVGVSAGAARDLAEFVVPEAFRDSKSYEVAVKNSLGFLISNVGTLSAASDRSAADSGSVPQPSGRKPENPAVPFSAGRFLARKAAGNFIDIAGLATLHVSPLWVLAIVSDAAYGTKTYVVELAQELQKQGLIDDTSTIHRVDDLLQAIQTASGTAASHFDQPPLSLDELRTSAEQTRRAVSEIDPTQLIPEAEIGRYWNQMKSLATQEDLSLLGVSGAVTMQTVETIRGVTHGTLTGMFVAGKIINRNIFGHYFQALNRVREQGIWVSVQNTCEPYIGLAWGNITSSSRTWTEQVLDPGHFGRIRNFFRRLCGLARRPARKAHRSTPTE